MASIYVTETSSLQNAAGIGNWKESAQAAMLPALAEQKLEIGATSAASAAFSADTLLIRVHTDAVCHIKVGSDPTATTSTMRLVAGQTEYFGVKPGDKLAVIVGS